MNIQSGNAAGTTVPAQFESDIAKLAKRSANSIPGKLLGRMLISQKLTVFGVLAMISALSLFGLYWNQKNNAINHTVSQSRGIEYALALNAVMENMAQHRGMTAALLKGDSSFKPRVDKKLKEVNQLIQNVSVINAKYGDSFGLSSNWQSIVSDWQEFLKRDSALTPAENFRQHSVQIENMTLLLSDIGDHSGLYSNRQLDSAHSAQLLLNHLPLTSENLGKLRGKSSSFAAAGIITEESRSVLLQPSVLRASLIILDGTD